jgi:hypothetical protein
MRPLSTAQQKVYAAKVNAVHARARVSNDGGTTWVDLRTLRGRDFFLGATWSETVDQGLSECTVVVRREVDGWSLAPDMASSPINLESGTDFPFLQKGYTQLQVQTATMPLDSGRPASGDWVNVFHGVLCGVSTSSGTLELLCRDLGEYLMRTFIKVEREYGSDGGVPLLTVLNDIICDNETTIPRWKASTYYLVGDVVAPTPGPGRTGRSYRVSSITTGISGATEPTWPNPTGSVVNGGVTWTVNALIPGTPPTMLGDADWDLGRFLQKCDPLFVSLETLAMQIGWALRYRWDEGSGDPPGVSRYTLYSPDRDALSSVYTLTECQVRAEPMFRSTTDDIRNAVEVPYFDKGDLDPAGNPKPKVALVDGTTNAIAAASQARHGYRFMRYAPGAGANIDTAVEAERLALAAVLDLADMADCEVETAYLHFLQLGDAVTLPADGVNYDEDQVLSVVNLSHRVSDGKATTTLSLRTRPQVANLGWHKRAAMSGVAGTIPLEGPSAVENLEVSETTAGFTLAFTRPTRGRSVKDLELHLSTSPSFTPDDSTFWAQGDADSFVVTDLQPGTTYYAQVVPKDVRRNRGVASAEVSFTARYVEPRVLQPFVEVGSLLPNDSFEAQNDLAAPPDTWSLISGTWGTTASVTGTALSGGQSVKFSASQTNVLASRYVVARPGETYAFMAWVYRTTLPGTNVATIYLDFVDSAFSVVSGGTVAKSISVAATFTWEQVVDVGTAPTGTRYLRMRLEQTNTVNQDAYWDAARVVYARVPIEFMRYVGTTGNGSFSGTWANVNSVGGTYSTAGFYKGADEVVHLEGRITYTGTPPSAGSTIISSLPVGYRPASKMTYAVPTDSGIGVVTINTAGSILYESGGYSWLSLDGIVFRAA